MYPIRQKFVFVFLLIQGLIETLFAQTLFSTSDILATAKTQTAILLQERKIAALSAMSYKLPFIERIDLQTETDRFQLQRQEYRARASFNGWAENSSLKQQKEANKVLQEAERAVLFNNVLFDRYTLLVEYHFADMNVVMYRKLHQVFTEKRDVLQKMAKLSPNFNIEDLIKAEDAAFEYHQKIIESEGVIRKIEHFLARTLKPTDSLRLDTTNWIPLSMVRHLVAELPTTMDKNVVLERQSAKIKRLNADYNLEKAGTKKIIDYGQIKNNARNRDVITREWSVGVGFSIPYRGSAKAKLNEITLNRLDEENKFENLQTDLDLQIFGLQEDLNLIFEEYDFVQKQVNESQTLYSLEHYAKVKGGSPIVLLRMQELVLGRQAKLIGLAYMAYQKYIKLLDLRGKLSQEPFSNYLSVGLTTF